MRTFLTVHYDVTDLTEEEREQLALEAVVQGERSEGHPSVPEPEIEWSLETEEGEEDE